jgi:hypothetical protein
MKNTHTLLAIVIMVAFISCKKDPINPVAPPPPKVEMIYTDLKDREIKYQQSGTTLDVNNDNRADLFFGVQLIGDHINAVDKRQYIILSSLSTALPVNINEQIMPLKEKEIIPLDNFNGNNWYGASEIILMERNEFATGLIIWRGNWVDHGKKFLPFQVFKNNQRYNGWVELTADKQGERLILHRMAISKEAEKEIKAGE